MSVALWGANGFIGQSIRADNHIPVLHTDAVALPGRPIPDEITSVIWCAGFPGIKNVDDVQRNPVRSKLQNVWEPLELAHRCYEQGKRLLVLSSGCIFDRLNEAGLPHTEEDTPNFTGTVYLSDKYELEQHLLALPYRPTIFRIRVPFNGSHHPRNALHKIASFPAVWDIHQSYTWLPDLKRAVQAWERGKINGGVWHVTQPGTLSNYEAVRKYLNPDVGAIRGNLHEHQQMACPRSAAILDSSKLQSVLSMTPAEEAWAIACKEYLQ